MFFFRSKVSIYEIKKFVVSKIIVNKKNKKPLENSVVFIISSLKLVCRERGINSVDTRRKS